MTSNDGPLTENLMHLTYKEEMHLANIREFAKKKKKEKKKDFTWRIYFGFCTG